MIFFFFICIAFFGVIAVKHLKGGYYHCMSIPENIIGKFILKIYYLFHLSLRNTSYFFKFYTLNLIKML